MNAASLSAQWANCVDLLKDRINNRSFWEALEATTAIVIEGDTLVVGLEAEEFNRSSHILQVSTLAIVHRAVNEVFGAPLQLKLIEGSTPADWETHKQREAYLASVRATAAQSPVSAPRDDSRATSSNWEGVYEQIARLYAQTPHRTLPQGRARFANEAIYLLVEAMDSLYSEPADDNMERGLARIIDRISSSSEIPPSVIAFEMERLRAWRKSETAS